LWAQGLGYGFKNSGTVVLFQAGARYFSHFLIVQRSHWAHAVCYMMATCGSFPGWRLAGPWGWSLTFIYCRD